MQQNRAGEQKSLKQFGRFSLIILLSTSILFAGSFEDFKKQQYESFDNFKDEKDAEFNKYLKQEFKAYMANQGITVYEKAKPKHIPTAAPIKSKSVGPKTIIKIKNIKHVEPKIIEVIKSKEKIEPKASELIEITSLVDSNITKSAKYIDTNDTKEEEIKKDLYLSFYGSTLGFSIPSEIKNAQFIPKNQKGIMSFFQTAASSEYEVLIEDINNVKNGMQLNDWGMYLLVLEISNNIFSSPDESKLLSWFIFNKLGYAVKVGLAKNHVVLMHYSKKTIYSTPSYTFSKKNFYVVSNYDKGSVGRVYTYRQNYPDADKALDLSMKTLPSFTSNMKDKTLSFSDLSKEYKINYSYNQNLIDFMGTYPQADYETYFNAPVDARTYKSIASSLKKYIDGKQISDAMNFVLKFVQNAFVYERDDQQFGREKVMFAEETLYFNKSDCEDRAVLYSYLIKELFGIKVVGVKYKDHMATALYVPMKGDSVKAGSKSFIIADPTYINAKIGQSMPKYKSLKPESFIMIGAN